MSDTPTYLDHAATTPMRQCAIDAWVEHARAVNPGSQYAAGRAANAVLQQAREQVGELLGADPVEVVFTGSGTEADNIAVRGLYAARVAAGAPQRVVASTIEHPAVLESVRALEAAGAEVAWLEAGRDGHVADLAALDRPAAVAALMWANNETGAIQPVAQAAERAAAAGTPLHVDAVQAVGKVPVDAGRDGHVADLAALDRPAAVAALMWLLAKRSPGPQPLVVGGGQERGLRSGTVDVAAAAATAAALAEAVSEMEAERARVRGLRDDLVARVRAEIQGATLTTAEPALDGHAHFMFTGANADAMLMLLDGLGIEASAGSACSAGVVQLSPVLEAMGIGEEEGMGALRLTLGRTTTQADVDRLVAELPAVVERARAVGRL
ncbi:cysteine desulfurase [Corynebacterium sp. CNCTC7651]|uniref:cysteine desulfurase family protein n=1 Tax=Corynebacterium sp. CNCTC7651 TaxID=2815361 RepID=UPI001F179ACB|nr:cysteine desulfurase family protein [Corynebacterium sp. CNCTC7651]UIZ92982.1 cysteine desulfurase [Corynebacterium sp. CNCTC7651]